MATLALSAAGAAIGSAVLPSGLTAFGVTLTGAAIGAQVGSIAGSFVDNALLGAGPGRSYDGTRLDEITVTASSEGAPVPRIYGVGRVGGQVIWAGEVEEVVRRDAVGGKGGLTGGATATTFEYFASFAVGLCEGEIAGIGRIWADGRLLDLEDVTYRVHRGGEDQSPDSLIASLSDGAAPAYRGLAYVVFERLALAPFGNRIPQVSFEVFRPVSSLNDRIRGTVLIPGSGDFAYATTPVTRTGADGTEVAENVHTAMGVSDVVASLDQRDTLLPNVANTSVIVSWFGTDLRAGACEIRPGVERDTKPTKPLEWRVGDVERAEAYVVSAHDGRPAYGGTPSDASVVELVQEIKSRGQAVTLSPFILMDVAATNTLPDPYGTSAMQPAYPWRGRITVDPAPGVAGSVDGTAAAADQIAQFVGQAAPDDFAIVNGRVSYSGPDEWSFRRQILHSAWLAKLAGGVDAFALGSELRGLTQVRDGAGGYPFVDALVQLAADVRGVLGDDTAITYAADWSEYFGHQPQDGSGDVTFHLDPLWASPDIAAVGIDLYWPLSDWRNGDNHADRTITDSIYDLDYLRGNLTGGEGYDWYYASDADRAAQVRTPITDGAGKPWVYRFKDVANWWANPHVNRVGGIEVGAPTAWQPQMKPVWLMEIGCGAVRFGTNQPNVFVDPKSTESSLPHFSDGAADELIQRRHLEALLSAIDPADPHHLPALVETSAVYGGPMIDLSHTFAYAWDARPYPAFPFDTDAWGDGDNWRLGHWLNGRFAASSLDELIAAILGDHGFSSVDVDGVFGAVPGLVVDRIMSARETLQALELAFALDIVESGGRLKVAMRGRLVDGISLDGEGLVETDARAPLKTVSRVQESELPERVKVRYVSRDGDFAAEVAEAARTVRSSQRVAEASLGLVLTDVEAQGIAERWLFETWTARDRVQLSVPPSRLAIEPGDGLTTTIGSRPTLARIISVDDSGVRTIEAMRHDPADHDRRLGPPRARHVRANRSVGAPTAAFLDLPRLRSSDAETVGYVAISQTPWPGPVTLETSATGSGFGFADQATIPATIGQTLTALIPGPVWRPDDAAHVDVQLSSGALASRSWADVLAGANAAALETAPGVWAVLQFAEAQLIGPRRYRLSRLLRGQLGTEAAMAAEVAVGARFVLLDEALLALPLDADTINRPAHYRFGPAGRAISATRFATAIHTFQGIGRRPLSPVHARSKRTGDGIDLTWIRRTRTDGDSWEQVDVPLAEAERAYAIDVLSGETVVRTITTDRETLVYASEDIAADFGVADAPVTFAIHQLSQTWGRGPALLVDV